MTVADPPDGDPSTGVLARLERPAVAVGLCIAVYLPFALLGYGTDIDVAAVLEAGQAGWTMATTRCRGSPAVPSTR